MLEAFRCVRRCGRPASIRNRSPLSARKAEDVLGYAEVHIEQGPILLNENLPLGVVTAIAGSVRYNVAVTGQAGHAGTVPMSLRRDAAAAAAEMILAVEQCCSGAPGLVGTVGKLAVPNGAVNVIPGQCEFTIDLRAGDNETRDAALQRVFEQIESIARRRNVGVEIRRLMAADATALFAKHTSPAGAQYRSGYR